MKGDTRSSRRRRLPPLLHWNWNGLKLCRVVLTLYRSDCTDPQLLDIESLGFPCVSKSNSLVKVTDTF